MFLLSVFSVYSLPFLSGLCVTSLGRTLCDSASCQHNLLSSWWARVPSRDLEMTNVNDFLLSLSLSLSVSRCTGWTWLRPSDAPELGPARWTPHSPRSAANMLIKEYRIPMPMSLEEYRIAQLYMIQVSLFFSFFIFLISELDGAVCLINFGSFVLCLKVLS